MTVILLKLLAVTAAVETSPGFWATVYEKLLHEAAFSYTIEMSKLVTIGLLSFLGSMVSGWILILIRWRKKKRDDRNVAFSTSFIEDGVFKILPMPPVEITLAELFPDEDHLNHFHKRAKKTTTTNPLIELATDGDKLELAILIRIRNFITRQYAAQFAAAKAVGKPVQTARFIFMPTYERYESVDLEKARVVLVAMKTLNDQIAQNDGLRFEFELHRDRPVTLRQIAQAHYRMDDELRKYYEVDIPV